eukprot:UN24594
MIRGVIDIPSRLCTFDVAIFCSVGSECAVAFEAEVRRSYRLVAIQRLPALLFLLYLEKSKMSPGSKMPSKCAIPTHKQHPTQTHISTKNTCNAIHALSSEPHDKIILLALHNHRKNNDTLIIYCRTSFIFKFIHRRIKVNT